MEIVWRAFELRPEPVPALDPGGEYLEKVWRRSVYPLAEEIGLPMKLPPLQPRSRRAHEAAAWAKTMGKFNEYNEALFRAFFQFGRDIGDAAVLCDLAQQVGLDPSHLEVSLRDGEFTAGVLQDERTAADLALGGVPAFVVDRRVAVSGVQSVDALLELLDAV